MKTLRHPMHHGRVAAHRDLEIEAKNAREIFGVNIKVRSLPVEVELGAWADQWVDPSKDTRKAVRSRQRQQARRMKEAALYA